MELLQLHCFTASHKKTWDWWLSSGSWGILHRNAGHFLPRSSARWKGVTDSEKRANQSNGWWFWLDPLPKSRILARILPIFPGSCSPIIAFKLWWGEEKRRISDEVRWKLMVYFGPKLMPPSWKENADIKWREAGLGFWMILVILSQSLSHLRILDITFGLIKKVFGLFWSPGGVP